RRPGSGAGGGALGLASSGRSGLRPHMTAKLPTDVGEAKMLVVDISTRGPRLGLYCDNRVTSVGRHKLRSDSEFARPAEPILGAAGRAVFATDPVAVADPIEGREDRGIVDLALVGLVARGHGSDLHVRDHREMLLEARDQVTADDLRMVEIELDANIRPPD